MKEIIMDDMNEKERRKKKEWKNEKRMKKIKKERSIQDRKGNRETGLSTQHVIQKAIFGVVVVCHISLNPQVPK